MQPQATKQQKDIYELIIKAKKLGFTDEHIANLIGVKQEEVKNLREKLGIKNTFKMVDTCAGEFKAETPYFYSSYEQEDEVIPSKNKKVLIIGSGPNRIGQGIEFDYCCVHGVFALMEEGISAIIINNNPETVSTDFDVSSRLYFEPLTLEDVINVIEKEKPNGVILQFGGQTSINLAVSLEKELKRKKLKTKILGTSPNSIDLAEDRERFDVLMEKMKILRPKGFTGNSFEQVKNGAKEIGYPVLVRPSYVLGGRGMEIVNNEKELEEYMERAVIISKEHPVLVDKYLTNAIEIDVDALCDEKNVFIAGILEHIEEAGVHSGDASMVLPPQSLPKSVIDEIRKITKKIAIALKTIGLINIQLAVKDNLVYVIEANPRASRTVPFVSKAIGIPLVKIATKIMLGKKLRKFNLTEEKELKMFGYWNAINLKAKKEISHVSVKASVFPFLKLRGVDTILGPEMKSTGEVMGIDENFGKAFYKAMLSAGLELPKNGTVFISVNDEDKKKILPIAKELSKDFKIVATKGTANFLKENGINAEVVFKISENKNPDAIGLMRSGEIKLIINTPSEIVEVVNGNARRDGYMMRRVAVDLNIPFISTIAGAKAVSSAIKNRAEEVKSLGVD